MGCRDSNGNLKPESPCAKAAKARATAKAKLAAQAKTAPGSQYAKAVEKGQRASDK